MQIFFRNAVEIKSEFTMDSGASNYYVSDLMTLTNDRLLVAHTMGSTSINAVFLNTDKNTFQATYPE